MSARLYHSCAVRSDKTVVCWGTNWDPQVEVPPGQFTAVTTRLHHTCAIATDQTIDCWTKNVEKPAGVS